MNLRFLPLLFLLLASCGPSTDTADTTDAGRSATQTTRVILTDLDPAKKIAAIKEIRAIAMLGLRDAKDMVDNLPRELELKISEEEAQPLIERLQRAGLSAEVRSKPTD